MERILGSQRLIRYPKLFNWVINKVTSDPKPQRSVVRMVDELEEKKRLTKISFYFRLLSLSRIKHQ